MNLADARTDRMPTPQPPRSPSTAETTAEYLARRRAIAYRSASMSFGCVERDLGDAFDPRYLARRFPWTTVGASAVAGFAAANLVLPRPQPPQAASAETRPVPDANSSRFTATSAPARSRFVAALTSTALPALYGLGRILLAQVVDAAIHDHVPDDPMAESVCEIDVALEEPAAS